MKYQLFIVLFVFMVFGSSLMAENQQATGQVNNDTIYAFDYSAAAGMYATGHYDWKIRIWDAATNTLLHTIQAPDLRPNGQGDVFSIQQLAFSPSGERLAACFYAEGGAILVIDTSTGQTLLDISESLPTMKAITWSSDGDRLAGIYEWSAIANEWDGWLALWDAGTGQEIRQTLIGGSPVSLDWHPSDDRLIYPSYTGVSVWDTEQWQELVAIPFESEVVSVAWSPNGDSFATIDAQNAVRLWNGDTGELQRELNTEDIGAFLPSVFWSETGDWVGANFEDRIEVWDTQTGMPVLNYESENEIVDAALLANGDIVYATRDAISRLDTSLSLIPPFFDDLESVRTVLHCLCF